VIAAVPASVIVTAGATTVGLTVSTTPVTSAQTVTISADVGRRHSICRTDRYSTATASARLDQPQSNQCAGTNFLDGYDNPERRGAVGRGDSDAVQQSQARCGSEQHYCRGRRDDRTGGGIHEPAGVSHLDVTISANLAGVTKAATLTVRRR
jgi:hypothetical protein